MKKYTLLIILVLLCLTSCKKEDKNSNLYSSDTLLSQVNSGDLAVHGLTYNSSYLIYESMEPYIYRKYTYDSQNNLRKVETAFSFNPLSCVAIPGASLESDPRKASISQYSEFEYDNALRLKKKSNYSINNGAPRLNYYLTYDYLNDKIVKLNFYNPQGQLTQYNNYTYDENGNIIKDDLYISGTVFKLISSTISEFDNKNNPYRVFASEGDPGKSTNTNNIIKETYVSYSGTAESSSTTMHTYEYNSLDYPVKIDNLDCIYGK
jgi:hypothetical protein